LSSFFDKLNLRPGERRLVIIVAIVVFILLNAFFVWPHFGDWGKLQKRQRDADALLKAYQAEVDKTSLYQRQLAELEKQGATVASEDQALKLANAVQQQAALSGVQQGGWNPSRPTAGGGAKPNQFFEEQRGSMPFTAEEKQLVDFLYNLGVGSSLIRVSSMTLTPDNPQTRYKLQGSLTFVASYAKKAPPKVTPVTSPPRTNAPAVSATSRSTSAVARANTPFGSKNTNPATKK
jgi:hypothetical protein